MANKKKGYIAVWRSIQDHWLWNNGEKFDERSAWIDLLLSVNHQEKKMKTRGGMVTIKPGQMWISYQNIAHRWGWSKGKVYRYFETLRQEDMIHTHGTTNGTLLTLVNYDNFNIRRNANGTSDETPNETPNGTTNETQTIMNYKGKKGNNPPISPQGDSEQKIKVRFNDPEFKKQYPYEDGWRADAEGYMYQIKKKGEK